MLIKTVRLSVPALEPVTLAEAKAQLRIDGTEEDLLIASLISAARERVENYTNRFYTECQVALIFDKFSILSEPISLGIPDLLSVDEIKYIFDNVETIVSPADYVFDNIRQEIRPVNEWPLGYSVRVDITTNGAICPPTVKQAILLYISDFFEIRGNLTPENLQDNRAAVFLLQPYRVNLGI